MSMLVLLPLLAPLAAAFACVLAAGRPRLQLFLSWTGLSVLLVCAAPVIVCLGEDTPAA